jgi:hypothetical protein
MSTNENSPSLARPGDVIGKKGLKPAADDLIAMARLLEPDIENATTPKQLAALMKANGDLLEQARKLIENDIALIVDEARIFADQVRAAIAESQEVIAKIEDVKAKLGKVGAVLDFVAVVATGSGTKIFQAAFDLRKQLDQP